MSRARSAAVSSSIHRGRTTCIAPRPQAAGPSCVERQTGTASRAITRTARRVAPSAGTHESRSRRSRCIASPISSTTVSDSPAQTTRSGVSTRASGDDAVMKSCGPRAVVFATRMGEWVRGAPSVIGNVSTSDTGGRTAASLAGPAGSIGAPGSPARGVMVAAAGTIGWRPNDTKATSGTSGSVCGTSGNTHIATIVIAQSQRRGQPSRAQAASPASAASSSRAPIADAVSIHAAIMRPSACDARPCDAGRGRWRAPRRPAPSPPDRAAARASPGRAARRAPDA